MNCKNCGTTILDGALFCTNCGCSTVPTLIKKNNENKKLKIIGIICACLFLIISFAFGFGSIVFAIGLIPILIYFTKETKRLKSNCTEIQTELDQIKSTFTPEMYEADNLRKLKNQLEENISTYESIISSLTNSINELETTEQELKSQIINLNEEAMLQEFGLYQPKYDFADSDTYKFELQQIRDKQKLLVKNGNAVTGNQGWTVNGSKAEGNKMVKDMQKLLLRAFNSDCDELINNVKFNTFDTAVKRMQKSFEIISKCGRVMSVAITKSYYNAKYEELCLALEYRQKKQAEKEEQKEIRARMREEAKLQKEIEEARKRIQKEQAHYSNALEKINEQISNASADELPALLEKKSEIESQLAEIDKSIKDIDYREANARAGYVYIISNIGAFGENVYKIGMTRRLEPMERIDELGDASVPFNFDVHAMIFSDNAPALEAALHTAFENRKLNMINKRREFFNVTLDEIEAVVRKNYDKTVEFTRLPQAEQYRESMKIRAELSA